MLLRRIIYYANMNQDSRKDVHEWKIHGKTEVRRVIIRLSYEMSPGGITTWRMFEPALIAESVFCSNVWRHFQVSFPLWFSKSPKIDASVPGIS